VGLAPLDFIFYIFIFYPCWVGCDILEWVWPTLLFGSYFPIFL